MYQLGFDGSQSLSLCLWTSCGSLGWSPSAAESSFFDWDWELHWYHPNTFVFFSLLIFHLISLFKKHSHLLFVNLHRESIENKLACARKLKWVCLCIKRKDNGNLKVELERLSSGLSTCPSSRTWAWSLHPHKSRVRRHLVAWEAPTTY